MDLFRSLFLSVYSWLPRTRGDGPFQYRPGSQGRQAPPHTRGWTPYGQVGTRFPDGSPAHAGMDRSALTTLRAPTRLPRTRGDGPPMVRWELDSRMAPPHTRGWTARR